ncbi:ammonia-dependent NAD(+) synthetase [Lacticigenium naphthae]|uniref:ammonia-dependent NAD(+) synthetase n=1 Tax=Lacticigenium naphthae TaxID=515351 RepID=UPI00040E6D8B
MISETQKKIIAKMKVSPQIVPAKEARNTIDLMKEYLKKHPFLKTFVLGISGGQDSTLLGKLAQMTMIEMRKETGNSDYQFIAVRLPYGEQVDESDAMDAIEWMQADVTYRVNIQKAVDHTTKSLQNSGIVISDFNEGNIKARQRMIVQYAIAGDKKGIVLGTDHSAESVTGFYTKYGDGGTDLNPLFRLNKRQGKEILRYLKAPEHLIDKVPTADLEDDRPGLADEVALGVTYDAIDDYLEGKEVSEKDAKIIEKWFEQTKHKRHMPITIFDDFWKT